MPAMTPSRRRLCACLVGAGLAAAACSRPAPPAELVARWTADGSMQLEVAGRSGLEVAIVANRPWRGEELIHAGLVGGRVSSDVDWAASAGVGTLGGGVLGATPLVVTLPAARVAALPVPLAIQGVLGERRADGVTVTVTQAWRFDRRDGSPELAPFGWRDGLAGTGRQWLWFVLLPLALVAGVRRLRERHRVAVWVLPFAIAGALAARIHGDQRTWPWSRLHAPDELTILDRTYGPGFADLVAAVRAARGADEPAAIVLAPGHALAQQVVAAHLARVLAPCALVPTLPDDHHGIVVRLPPSAPTAAERTLATTPLATATRREPPR
jgi:hypothetical protein